MPADTYRSLELASAARFEALLDRHVRESPLATAARAIVARRVACIAAGAAATLLGATAFVVAFPPFADGDGPGRATVLLLMVWPWALVVGLVAAGLARVATARSLDAPSMPPPDSTLSDLARLEESSALRAMRRLAGRLEGWSAAAPLAGLAMTAPLTLHLLVALVFGRPFSLHDFDWWIGVSTLLVGPAHLALVFLATRWGLSLRRRESGALRERIHWHWGKALLITMGVSGAPSLLLVLFSSSSELAPYALIPVGITVVTGLAFVPAMYLLTARRIARERLALA
jgi:hypothetical protein